MTITRRILLGGLAAGAAIASFASSSALAQDWPTETITILVGYPAGGANDLVARAMTDGLSERLGVSVVVENRTGAAGVVAGDATWRAEPNGYTLYMMSSAQTLAPSIREVSFDPAAFEPIALGASGSYLLLTRKDLGAGTVPDLIAMAKEKPGALTYASSGIGAGPHLTGELFKTMAEVDILHVPYRGDTPVLTDMLAGRVDMGFVAVAPSQQYVENGDLVALAVSGAERVDTFSELPTVEEAGNLEGFAMGAWWGLVAPPETPQEIVDRVTEAAIETLATEKVQSTLTGLGFEPGSLSGAEFGEFIASEVGKFAGIVEKAKIEVE
ncbi:MAG: tripartite tricarboxylate transporter substrate binding protein [Aquamicrobium sp.]|nr:tripartite tricarboxylate transporter substrate binding protein [Aquamicrobium sp.]